MRWLVDGMNVVGSRPDGWWRDRRSAIVALAEELSTWAAATDEQVTVVFDGRPFDVPAREAVVLFASGRGRNAADDEMMQMVEGDAEPASLRVVTSDRELARRVRERGAQVMTAGSFRRSLARWA